MKQAVRYSRLLPQATLKGYLLYVFFSFEWLLFSYQNNANPVNTSDISEISKIFLNTEKYVASMIGAIILLTKSIILKMNPTVRKPLSL